MASYKKNLRLVQDHLQEGETIIASISGTYEVKIMGEDFVREGIFVVTENRLIFFAKKLTGFDLETFPFENISSFTKSKGMMGHKISFFASGNNISMKWIYKGEIEEFTNYINSKIGKKEPNDSSQTQKEDIPSQIKKLAELKEQEILTEAEFNQKKAELLAKM